MKGDETHPPRPAGRRRTLAAMTSPETFDVGLVGDTLAGRFEIVERLGRGGMGEVYRALDRELDELVALKVVHDDVAQVPGVLDRFRAEVKLARRVTHRNVARTFELGLAGDVVFFTMELVVGASLAARLARGPLPPAEAVAIAVELCDALAAAHAVGVIHRDLKPDNVLLAEDGRVVLTDFGVASLTTFADGVASGSPAYMAPEQARGEAATPRVDVYALGLLLYEMVVGEAAYPGGLGTVLAAKQEPRYRPPRLDDLEPPLAAIVERAIALDPAARWPSVVALRHALAPDATRDPARDAAPPAPVDAIVDGSVDGLPTVQVLPVAAPPEVAALALGLHDELLRRLARRSRLRLVRGPARDLGDGAWVTVTADAAAGATITIRQPGRRDHVELRVALDVDALVAGAELASRVIAAAVGAGRERGPDDAPLPALARAHLWRALERSRHDETDRLAADDDYAAAADLAGDHPRIMAGLAMVRVRQAFFSDPPRPDQLARATELATRAVALAPHAAEAHVAWGRVLLHHGDAALAAVHFRTAIARAPYLTDGHEWLGRLLLEAGYVVEGEARMAEALAMDPDLELPRWDLARSLALEERWAEHDAVAYELNQRPGGIASRLAVTLRVAGWRGDRATIARVREITARFPTIPWFERALIDLVCDATLAGAWPQVRDRIIAMAAASTDGGARRRAFLGQIIAEVACGAGDLEVGLAMLTMAVDSGLFDRHWLERCPLLVHLRADPRYPPLHARVASRAHAILDAFYGDHAARTSDTVLVVDGPS